MRAEKQPWVLVLESIFVLSAAVGIPTSISRSSALLGGGRCTIGYFKKLCSRVFFRKIISNYL